MPEAAREPGWLGMARRRGALARLLWPVSLVYRALLAGRRIAYALGLARVETLPVPVLVVGNVVVGGAGKTPTTIALVQHLRERGWRVGVISRGHGRRDGAVLEVLDDSDPARCGDEPLLIRRRTGVPVWVGRRRAAAGRALLAAHAEVNCLVCDDGLQHWSLHSDLRVAVFDDRGLGNGWLLPAGLLREPWPVRHPAHAPHLVLCPSREAATPELPLPAGMPRFHARRRLADFAIDAEGRRQALSDFGNRPTLALAAIARPDTFFAMLAAAGVAPQRCVSLPDHAGTPVLQQALADWHGDVLCTEKDLVKLGALPARLRAWAVPLVLDIEPAFFAAIDARLPPPPG
jgi:tetraacyldisaccharide 4'-kinase